MFSQCIRRPSPPKMRSSLMSGTLGTLFYLMMFQVRFPISRICDWDWCGSISRSTPGFYICGGRERVRTGKTDVEQLAIISMVPANPQEALNWDDLSGLSWFEERGNNLFIPINRLLDLGCFLKGGQPLERPLFSSPRENLEMPGANALCSRSWIFSPNWGFRVVQHSVHYSAPLGFRPTF